MNKTIKIDYQEYGSVGELAEGDAALMGRAMEAARGAYAPYSLFSVGAALLLDDGTVVVGNNQENAAYPSGLCAERTALFAASAQRPDCRRYRALAIVGIDREGRFTEASPCGACRQVMAEYEQGQGFPMRVLCYLDGGGVRVFPEVKCLLPFAFEI